MATSMPGGGVASRDGHGRGAGHLCAPLAGGIAAPCALATPGSPPVRHPSHPYIARQEAAEARRTAAGGAAPRPPILTASAQRAAPGGGGGPPATARRAAAPCSAARPHRSFLLCLSALPSRSASLLPLPFRPPLHPALQWGGLAGLPSSPGAAGGLGGRMQVSVTSHRPFPAAGTRQRNPPRLSPTPAPFKSPPLSSAPVSGGSGLPFGTGAGACAGRVKLGDTFRSQALSPEAGGNKHARAAWERGYRGGWCRRYLSPPAGRRRRPEGAAPRKDSAGHPRSPGLVGLSADLQSRPLPGRHFGRSWHSAAGVARVAAPVVPPRVQG